MLNYCHTLSIFKDISIKLKNHQSVSFQATGRYSILGNLDKKTKSILFVFHGQGQLAHFFIKKFSALQEQEITIIAPEGLHQYYLHDFSGRVGASWMTTENRLVAIQNYINFLNSVYNKVRGEVSKSAKISLLGFSQGTATVSRWVEQSNFEFEKLILWGGALPPDLNSELIFNRMKGKILLQVIGNKDPYIRADKITEIKKLVADYKLISEHKIYDGGHNIDKNMLINLFN